MALTPPNFAVRFWYRLVFARMFHKPASASALWPLGVGERSVVPNFRTPCPSFGVLIVGPAAFRREALSWGFRPIVTSGPEKSVTAGSDAVVGDSDS